MKLLDLFCGAGGAAVGYSRAGFTEIIGVDIVSQPNYPFRFIQADALQPPVDLADFDLIHASPPCQRYSNMTRNNGHHPDLIEPTRALLEASGRPYVIENVEQAPLLGYLRLCGSMFGLEVQRHRYFELSFPAWSPGGCDHKSWPDGRPWTITGKLDRMDWRYPHSWKPSLERAKSLMGVPWMTTDDEVREAIPPAYTKWVGEQFVAQCQEVVL